MRHHFVKLHHLLWNLILGFSKLVASDVFLGPCKKSRQVSRTMNPIYVLLRLIFITCTLLLRVVFGAICFPFLLVISILKILWYSPQHTLRSLRTFRHNDDDVDDDENVSALFKVSIGIAKPLFKLWLLLSFYVTILFVNNLSCAFVNKALGYTIAGLVLNEDVITPYVAFFLVVTTNMYLCYANMQQEYKEVKEMILKWQKELSINSSDPEGTIRTKLFWFVCDRVLPIKSEICQMLRNMVLILTFLFFVVYSIVVFGKENNTSAIFSTIYVFVGGLIPVLVFKGRTKGNKFIGWAKIKIERDIERAVKEYNRDSTAIELGPYSTKSDDTIVNYGFRPILHNRYV